MNNPKTQSWLYLTNIQVGGSICLPVIMIGHLLCLNYGLGTALIAILTGNFILLILGLAATSMGAAGRKSTVEHAAQYLGTHSTKLFAGLMIACMLGWFAIQLNMMNVSFNEMLNSSLLPSNLSTLFLGGMITLLVSYGLTAMGKMANFCTPLLLITLSIALYTAPLPNTFTANISGFYWNSISLVMAASIASIIDLPNFFKYARSQRDGNIAIIILFGLATPLIEGIGVYLAYSMPDRNLFEAMHGGLGILSAFFLLMGGWITNNTNLFSAMVSAEPLLPFISDKHRVMILGLIGTAIACFNPAEHLEIVVNVMGIAIASMGGIIICGHLLGIAQHKSISYLCFWLCGTVVGFLSYFEIFSISSIAILDAFLVSALLTSFIKQKELLWQKSLNKI